MPAAKLKPQNCLGGVPEVGIDQITVTRNTKDSERSMTLVGWGELGGEVEGVDCSRVAQVVLKVLQGSLACHNGLDEESKHGEHSL